MTIAGFLRLALVSSLALPGAGCSFDTFAYTADRYGTVKGVAVSLRCRDVYEVFDRPEASTLLVVTNAVNEVAVACLDGGPPRTERQREIARIFLEEKTNRPGCTIVGQKSLTDFHEEVSYRCPAEPGEVSPRITRRRG